MNIPNLLQAPDAANISVHRQVQRFARLLSALWRHRLLPQPSLGRLRTNATEVIKQAEDGGSSRWCEPFEHLINSLGAEARLNEVGLTFAYVQLAGWLRLRERAQRLWRRNPHVLQVPIERPIIVLGHMRSGTTRLQRLLGCDPRFNHTRFYEVTNPLPATPDLRVPQSWAQLKLLSFLNPELDAIHPTSATAVEEVFGLFGFSFYGAQIDAQWRVPSFARYWEEQDRTWVYREFKHLLQTIAWRRGETAKPWVLKAPQFMEDLAPLLELFPDARLICLHRDFGNVVASSASLVWNQMSLQSDRVDPKWIGAEWLRKTVRRERTCAMIRAARSDVPQIDVQFSAMNHDWRSEMHRIYTFLDLELTPEVERSMDRYLRNAEKSGFRRHNYQPEDYGLDAEHVRNSVGS